MAADSLIRGTLEDELLADGEEVLASAEPSLEGTSGELCVTDRRVLFGWMEAAELQRIEIAGEAIEDVGFFADRATSVLQIGGAEFEFESVSDRDLIQNVLKRVFLDDGDFSVRDLKGPQPWYASGTALIMIFFSFWPLSLYGIAMRVKEDVREGLPFWHHPMPVWIGLVNPFTALFSAYGFYRRLSSDDIEPSWANYAGMGFAMCWAAFIGLIIFALAYAG
jgi:hypothetical protein